MNLQYRNVHRLSLLFRQRSRRSGKKRNKSRSIGNTSVPGGNNAASFCKNCGTIVGIYPSTSAKESNNISAVSTSTTCNVAENSSAVDQFGSSDCRGPASCDCPPEPCPNCGSLSRLVSCDDIPCPVGVLSSSHSSSDLSSPNESCYSFVRRALQVETNSCCSSAESSSSADKQVLHGSIFTLVLLVFSFFAYARS